METDYSFEARDCPICGQPLKWWGDNGRFECNHEALKKAAPDLLAACELVNGLLGISPSGHGIAWETVKPKLAEAIAKARAT